MDIDCPRIRGRPARKHGRKHRTRDNPAAILDQNGKKPTTSRRKRTGCRHVNARRGKRRWRVQVRVQVRVKTLVLERTKAGTQPRDQLVRGPGIPEHVVGTEREAHREHLHRTVREHDGRSPRYGTPGLQRGDHRHRQHHGIAGGHAIQPCRPAQLKVGGDCEADLVGENGRDCDKVDGAWCGIRRLSRRFRP